MQALPVAKRKTFSIYVRLTGEEKRKAEKAAERAGKRIAPWVLELITRAYEAQEKSVAR
jgi:hypothetical protein